MEMAVRVQKEKTNKFLEIRDPEKAVGLWSHQTFYETTLTPVARTRETIGRFFEGDRRRFETHAEVLEMLAKKGRKKSSSRKLAEFAAQFAQEIPPPWFVVWRRFAKWLDTIDGKLSRDVRLSFGYSSTGEDCCEEKHRQGRVIFLRKNGRHFLAVMMKDGWWGWDTIEKTAYQKDPYERLILTRRKGLFWQTVDADIITELVQAKQMCLFAMDENPVFSALTGEPNAQEKLARISRHVEFYVRDPTGPRERFYLKWGAMFNPGKRKYDNADKYKARIVEIMREREREWVNRQIKVMRADQAVRAAQLVATRNGCILLEPDASDEVRFAVMHALFYITFPDRPADAPGGILRGYQLPGRVVQRATSPVRFDGREALQKRLQKIARDVTSRKRALVVDTLLNRAARVVAERNGLDADEARRRIESVGGRQVLETAAWRWGFMEGNALNLFKPTPTAGALKLPDLSLALGFEQRLGLDGGGAPVAALVQTAAIRSLVESTDAERWSRDVVLKARRLFTPKPGREGDKLSYLAGSVRILRDEGRFLLLALPKFAPYRYGRDFLLEPDKESVGVKAYRFVSPDGSRSRKNLAVEEETFDINKVHALARDGRIILYSLDVGDIRWLFDAVYSAANSRPCRIVSTVPQVFRPHAQVRTFRRAKESGDDILTDVPLDMAEAEVRMTFVFNSTGERTGRKYQCRSWRAYCDAHPQDAGRPAVRWPSEGTLCDACRRVVETDGILLTDDEHFDAALQQMGYVVTQNADPNAPGGAYRGYMLMDRVFRGEGGRGGGSGEGGRSGRGADLKGKALCEVLSPEVAKKAEAEFAQRIETETLTDKKTAKFFTLEAPIAIGEDFKAMVAREFRRIAYTGTMGWRRQLDRPVREVALGIWIARLESEK